MSDDEPTIRDVLARLDGMQADIELRFATVASKDDALHIERAITDMAMTLLRHVMDPGAHGGRP